METQRRIPNADEARSTLEAHNIVPVMMADAGADDLAHNADAVQLIPRDKTVPGTEPLPWDTFFSFLEAHGLVVQSDEAADETPISYTIVPETTQQDHTQDTSYDVFDAGDDDTPVNGNLIPSNN